MNTIVEKQNTIVRDLKILVPLFTEKSIDIVNEEIQREYELYSPMSDFSICHHCDEYYDNCFCDDIYELTRDPTANYRAVVKFKNVLFERHIKHKTTLKQLVDKRTVVPQGLADLLLGTPKGKLAGVIDDIADASSSHSNAMNHFSDIVKELNSRAPSIDITTNTFHSVLQNMKSTLGNVNSTFQGLRQFKDWALFAFTLASGYYWSLEKNNMQRLGVFVCSAVIMHYFTSDSFGEMIGSFVRKILDFTHSLFIKLSSRRKDVVPELGAHELDGFASLLAAGLSGVLATQVKGNFTEGFVRILSAAPRIKAGFDVALKTIFSCFEYAINFARQNFFSLPTMRLFDSSSTEVDQFLDDLSALHNSENTGSLTRNVTSFNRIIELISRGKVIIKNVPRDKNSEGFLRLVNIEMKFLQDMFTVFKNLNFDKQGIRQEPVGILLQGGAGTGKSITVMHLANAMCASVLPEDEYQEFLASSATKVTIHAPETGFWDGYRMGSVLTVIDDFGQAADVPGVPDNEYMKVIRGVNAYEYMLHMAALEQKGTTFFDSKFLVCTTNLRKLDAKSIVSNEALNRRFPVRYIVSIKEDLCTDATKGLDFYNRKFDPKKLPNKVFEGKTYSSLCPEVQIFVPSDHNGTPCGEPIDFETFMDICMKEHDKRKMWQSTQDVEFKTTRDRYRSKYTERNIIVPESGDCDIEVEDIVLEDLEPNRVGNDPEFDINAYPKDGSTNEYMKSLLQKYPDNYVKVAFSMVDKERDTAILRRVGRKFQSHFTAPLVCIHLVMLEYYNKKWRSAVKDGNMEEFLTNALFEQSPSILETHGYHSFCPDIVRTLFNTMKTKAVELFDKTYSFISEMEYVINNSTILYLLVPILFSAGLYSYSSYILKLVFTLFHNSKEIAIGWYNDIFKKESGVESESITKDKMHTPKSAHKNYVVHTSVAKALVTPQSMTDLDKSGYDLTTSILKRSWFKLELERERSEGVFALLGACFLVKGRIMLMPYHFIRKFIVAVEDHPDNQYCKIHLYKDVGGVRNSEYYFTVADMIRGHMVGSLVHNDLVLVKLPMSFQIGVNRVKNFVKREDYNKYLTNVPFTMRCPKTDSDVVTGDFAQMVEETVVKFKEADCSYSIRKGYRYRGFTNGGDCGAMMSILDNKEPTKKFLGMHVAGISDKYVSSAYSYSAAVCQEDLIDDIALFGESISNCEKAELEIVSETAISYGNGRFESVGYLDRAPNAVLHTSIRESVLHGTFGECPTEPAMLRITENSEGKMIDPFENALTKYCLNVNLDYDEKSMSKAVADYSSKLLNLDMAHNPRLLKLRAILDGDDIDELLTSLTSSTSPGYPMNVGGHRNLKKEYYSSAPFSEEREKVFIEIEKLVNGFISSISNGVIPAVVYTDNLKDERRTKEKVELGKTRLFSGSPFIFLLVVKIYFGDFSLFFQRNKIDNEGAIGVNPYSLDWDRIARLLNTFGTHKNKGAGDYTAYDGSHFPLLQLNMLNIINEWYGYDPVGVEIRTNLFSCITYSTHVYRGIVYEWSGGMPSGNPLTALLNCMYNSIAFRYCWYRQDLDRPRFDTSVKLCVMGDDNIFSVHADYQNFNELTLPALMLEIGLVYTPEDKTSLLEHPFRALEEIEFLKRSFKFESLVGGYIAPIRFSVIEEMIQWTKKGSTGDEICVENVITGMREASLHGKARYDEYCSIVIPKIISHYPNIVPSEPYKMPQQERLYRVLNSTTFFL